jgi:hypothetical protein
MDRGRLFYNIYDMWGISPFPRDVIIDQQGIIRYLNSEYDPQQMERVIYQLLQEENANDIFPKIFDLNVFPNPFNSMTNIEFITNSFGDYNLTLYDIRGRIFSSGLYIVSISNQSKIESKKLILLK